MEIAATVDKYLTDNGIAYQVITHRPTKDSMHTAEAAHISGEVIAKAVILKDDDGYLAALTAASHRLQLNLIQDLTGRGQLKLVPEDEIAGLFKDCEIGAIPAVVDAYDLSFIWDKRLSGLENVYFEGGDHVSLVRVSGADFDKLMGDSACGILGDHM